MSSNILAIINDNISKNAMKELIDALDNPKTDRNGSGKIKRLYAKTISKYWSL